MGFQPLLQIQILLHPTAAGVEYQDAKVQNLSFQQITFNELFPLERSVLGNPSVSVPWKIDEIMRTVDSIEVDRLRATGSVTGKSQPFCAREGIDQAGLANVTAS